MWIPTTSDTWNQSRTGGVNSDAPLLWDGGVAFLPMNEGSGSILHDVSGFENNGVQEQQDQAGKWEKSPLGPCLRFDGSDDLVDLGAPPKLQYTRNFSVSFWIRTSTPVTGFSIRQIASKYTDSAPRRGWLFEIVGDSHSGGPNGEVRWVTSGATATSRLETDISVTDDVWHHLVGTSDADNNVMRLFLDGQLMGETTTSAISDMATIPVYLGWSTNTTRFRYAGLMTEFSNWDRALNVEECLSLYRDSFARYRPRYLPVSVSVGNDVTGTNAFGSSGVDFSWTVNP